MGGREVWRMNSGQKRIILEMGNWRESKKLLGQGEEYCTDYE